MKGRAPTREEKKWMDLIARLGCIVCLKHEDIYTPAEVHHLYGKTKKGAHLNTIGLCFKHHREGSNNKVWVSRHPWKAEFEKRYGSEESLLNEIKNIIGDTNESNRVAAKQ